jgi:hypothetical protein
MSTVFQVDEGVEESEFCVACIESIKEGGCHSCVCKMV